MAYDIPEAMRPAHWRGRYRGQAITWVRMRYLGTDAEDVAFGERVVDAHGAAVDVGNPGNPTLCRHPVGVQTILFACGVRQHRGSQECGQSV